MKNKFFSVSAFFLLVLIIISVSTYFSLKGKNVEDERADYIIALNEISKLSESGDHDLADEKLRELQAIIHDSDIQEQEIQTIPVTCTASVLLFAAMTGYIYFAVLRPFEKMKKFAAKISTGDFEVPLNYERSNYFGEFTWAFDSMRNEITKSRANEKEAIENNKTIIATLSHDIKTPVASIRAYTEGLSANLDSTYEKRERYLSVIIKKCDEVARLTDDLFLHSVSDLEKLKIAPEKVEICSFIKRTISEISAEREDVVFTDPGYTTFVNADKSRLTQLCENIINNARKYAGTKVDVFFTKENDNILLHFRDYGGGIPDENMPFIFDKFYRGSNCGNQQGSGLGLYIVRYISEKMGGSVILQNHEQGLEVEIILPEIL